MLENRVISIETSPFSAKAIKNFEKNNNDIPDPIFIYDRSIFPIEILAVGNIIIPTMINVKRYYLLLIRSYFC